MIELEVESLLLRVYCIVSDKVDNQTGTQTLHEAIVESARHAGLAGASALKAKMGFGHSKMLYSNLLSEVFIENQPVIVEIIDQPDRVQSFLPTLHALVQGRRLITTERAEIIFYQPENTII
jgi:hypothetical protein